MIIFDKICSLYFIGPSFETSVCVAWKIIYDASKFLSCRGSNLKSLDTSLTQKNEDLMECNNQRIRAEEKVKNLQQEREDKDNLVNRLKDEIVSSNFCNKF